MFDDVASNIQESLALGSYDPDASAPGAPPNNETFTWTCANSEQPCPADLLGVVNQGGKMLSVKAELLLVDGRYKFTVLYANNGRHANASTEVKIVADPVPTVTVGTPDPPTVASTAALRLQGTVARTSGAGAITISWTCDPATVDFTKADDFLTPTNSPSLVIKPG